tara:strand:- start:1049 stop:1282 length:234 start_codon:yes stop_codon:yes gene_type:complete
MKGYDMNKVKEIELVGERISPTDVIINELHYLLSSADKNNRTFILSKLSSALITRINYFGDIRNMKNDFNKKKGYEV